MDIISFNEAATANSRIESFNANPDSTSGVVTVPTTIAAGETITIPAGRMAVLPDLQIYGDLVVDGEVFIPNGTSLSKVVEKVTSTDNAIVRFDGTTGAVQNSGVIIDDSNNVFSGVVYSGGTSRGNGSVCVKRSSDNLTVGSFTADDTNSKLSIATAYSNITFSDYAGDRLSIVGGNVGIGTNSPLVNLEVKSGTPSIITNGTGAGFRGYGIRHNGTEIATMMSNPSDGETRFTSGFSGFGGYSTFYTNGSERMRIDTAGNVLLTSGTGALGYGAGSGGTVTQLTSKSTSITLNKPTGQITTSNSALAAGANVTFTLNNSVLTLKDTIEITLDGYSVGAEIYTIRKSVVNGAAYINIKNDTATSYSDAIVLNFTVIKGAIS